eukprot:363169-Chlamydomonas_euryale.AAC.37
MPQQAHASSPRSKEHPENASSAAQPKAAQGGTSWPLPMKMPRQLHAGTRRAPTPLHADVRFCGQHVCARACWHASLGPET